MEAKNCSYNKGTKTLKAFPSDRLKFVYNKITI